MVCDVCHGCWRTRRTCDVRRVLFCMLEAVERELCLLEVLDVLEVMLRVLLCILEAVEGRLYSLEVMR